MDVSLRYIGGVGVRRSPLGKFFSLFGLMY
jgi:hypothetical protein